jgi:glycolate oxidase FAD binding subunit
MNSVTGALAEKPMPDQTTCDIEGLTVPVSEPSNAQDVGELVRHAVATNTAIYPLGGGMQLYYGYPPTKPGIGIGLRNLNRVIDYPARDMTITVEAGITIDKLREVLASEKQELPVDVPIPQVSTLGGSLGTNTCGSRRYRNGTLRDYVIGMTVINDLGEDVKAGGRVVKNVAGYDLCKLYIGSLGTLGIVAQVTLKVKPLSENQAATQIVCDVDALESVLDIVHHSRTRPISIDLIDDKSGVNESEQCDAYSIVVAYEDNEESVAWQIHQLQRELQETKCDLRSSVEGVPRLLTVFQAQRAATISFKANLRPHATASFILKARSLAEPRLLHAYPGNGIVFGHVYGDLTMDRAQAIVKELQDLAAEGQGNLAVLRCPSAWKNHLPIWGRPRGDEWLMRKIKKHLDPNDIFNPGRLFR